MTAGAPSPSVQEAWNLARKLLDDAARAYVRAEAPTRPDLSVEVPGVTP